MLFRILFFEEWKDTSVYSYKGYLVTWEALCGVTSSVIICKGNYLVIWSLSYNLKVVIKESSKFFTLSVDFLVL